MSDVVIFKNNEVIYRRSVNTPDFEGDPDTLINPDLSRVQGVEPKYWRRLGNQVREMTKNQKDAVDAAEVQKRKDEADRINIDYKTVVEGIIVAGNQRWSKGQTITKQELIDWLKDQIN